MKTIKSITLIKAPMNIFRLISFCGPFCIAAACVAAVYLFVGTAHAEQTRYYNLEGFGNWLDGNPESTVVTEGGEIELAKKVTERYTDTAASYSAAALWRGNIIVARVSDNQVLLIDKKGEETPLFKVDSGVVTALLVIDNVLYIASGPPFKLHQVRLSKMGKKGTHGKTFQAKLLYAGEQDFVWDMVQGGGGRILAVTGNPGTVISIAIGEGLKKRERLLYTAEQNHLRSIAYRKDLGIFIGGGEKGVLYRGRQTVKKSTKQEGWKFFALFDSTLTEITSIVLQDTDAYISAVSGAAALASEQGNEQEGSGNGKTVKVRSQLMRVGMEGTFEMLAGSNDEAIFDVAVDDHGHIVVATGATDRDDPRGRLYTITPKSRRIAMLYQSPSRRITHLLNGENGQMVVVAAAGGRVVDLHKGYAKKGEFFTLPFDTGWVSKFGLAQIFGAFPKGTKASIAIKTGATKTPDNSWSDWSAEVPVDKMQAPQVSSGRYMQMRITLSSKKGQTTPRIHRVRLAYRRQNMRPYIRQVTVLPKGTALMPMLREMKGSKTITIGSKPDRANDKPKPLKARRIAVPGAVTLRWFAEDNNGDRLTYSLSYHKLGESLWKLLEKDLRHPFYTLHSSQLADGHYVFRVDVSDQLDNPKPTALSDSSDSRTVLIDNTPPVFSDLKVTLLKGARARVAVQVADVFGVLTVAAYALDGKEFKHMLPVDGILDGPGERFVIELNKLTKGPHSVTLQVIDEAGNSGFKEAQFMTP